MQIPIKMDHVCSPSTELILYILYILITLTEWRISRAKIVNRLDAPAQWNFAMWTPKGPTVKICVGDAKANAYPVIALSVSNISFKWMAGEKNPRKLRSHCECVLLEQKSELSFFAPHVPPPLLPLPRNTSWKAVVWQNCKIKALQNSWYIA